MYGVTTGSADDPVASPYSVTHALDGRPGGASRRSARGGPTLPLVPRIPDLDRVAVGGLTLVARAVDALPTAAALRIAGGEHVVDGQQLDPHLAVLLAAQERLAAPAEDRTPEQRRVEIGRSSRMAAGPLLRVGEVRDLTVRGGAGMVRARHYRPPGGGQGRPLVVFFHGGGWVVGDLDTHEQPCRLIAKHADVHVLSVDYRLAPEHPFPAAPEDALAAYRWALEHAAELGADPARIGVAGDSAGGNLAAVVSQTAKDEGGPVPAAQLLIYPGADAAKAYPSKSLFGEGYFLTRATMDWYVETYAGATDRRDPRLSPMHAADKAGLPPTVVTTGGFDPLRDEGEAYAAALRDAGVEVVLRRAPGLVHGYFSMGGINRASLEQTIGDIAVLRTLLDR